MRGLVFGMEQSIQHFFAATGFKRVGLCSTYFFMVMAKKYERFTVGATVPGLSA